MPINSYIYIKLYTFLYELYSNTKSNLKNRRYILFIVKVISPFAK